MPEDSNEFPSDNEAVQSLLEIDPHLDHFKPDLLQRYHTFKDKFKYIDGIIKGGWDAFATSYNEYGVHLLQDNTIRVKEFIENAREVYILGDFNNWNKYQYKLQGDEHNVYVLDLPPMFNSDTRQKEPVIFHNSRYKLLIITKDNKEIYRICPWAQYVVQNNKESDGDNLFVPRFINKSIESYQFTSPWPLKDRRNVTKGALRIYEMHVGISSEDYSIASYDHVREKVIPHIVYLGYNAVQLMAVMEHAYYASFGYQVTSFFAPSSRYGRPAHLKRLIDEFHRHNIIVLLDVVHSHASKNVDDGLNDLDGSSAGCYFHGNGRGYHSLWDSRLFDYSRVETLRFLISNLTYYLEEFHFDGFRFDGVTSMLYHTHGIGHGFSGDYAEYFNINVDTESVCYLQLANYYLHKRYPGIITIAEEVSGMPGLALPVTKLGLGFDYRLAMAIPDMWIRTLKEVSDENWDMANITWNLINRRHGEKCIAYAESHDQALVGDKTLAFWLMDAEMYRCMSNMMPKTPIIERGMALHKMIRLLTFALGGEGYLNFIGNEFGHPEWLDFPRAGNNSSYQYARRQWSLVHADHLRYRYLNEFDKCMQKLDAEHEILSAPQAYVYSGHYCNKVVCFKRGDLIFAFNFHTNCSYTNYKIGTGMTIATTNNNNNNNKNGYRVILNTDDADFDGQNRISQSETHHLINEKYDDQPMSIQVFNILTKN